MINANNTSFSIAHPNFHDISEFDEKLYISSCGHICKENCSFRTSRGNGRNDYHILYCREGLINLTLRNSKHVLKKGDMAFINFGVPHEYFCDKSQLVSYYWIHFKGKEAPTLLEDLNFNESFVLNMDYDEKISDLFEQTILTLHEQKDMYFKKSMLLLVSMLLEFYNKAIESNNIKHKEFSNIDNVISIMRADNCFEMTIDDFAEICHLSKSKFIKKFKKHTGYTPIAYRNIILIDKAKWYLKNTDQTISEISDIFGFLNTSYFSTLFKKHSNITPSEYRKKYNL